MSQTRKLTNHAPEAVFLQAVEPPESGALGPSSTRELFTFFTLVGLQGFGGLVGVVQRELVDKNGWLSLEEFTEDWSLAQALPGPNVINLALIYGERRFGIRGALVSMAGLLGAPLLLLLVITMTLSRFEGHVMVQGALRGMGAVAAGLIAASGIKMLPAFRTNAMGLHLCIVLAALTFGSVAVLRLPLAFTMLVLGATACLLAYDRIHKGAGSR